MKRAILLSLLVSANVQAVPTSPEALYIPPKAKVKHVTCTGIESSSRDELAASVNAGVEMFREVYGNWTKDYIKGWMNRPNNEMSKIMVKACNANPNWDVPMATYFSLLAVYHNKLRIERGIDDPHPLHN